MVRIRPTAAGLALVAVLAGCSDGRTTSTTSTTSTAGGAVAAAAADVDLAITTFSFSPASLTVPTGAGVLVTNDDPTTHTVTAGTSDEPTGAFDLRLAGKGATAHLGALEPGTYPYFCRIHTAMTGRLVVG